MVIRQAWRYAGLGGLNTLATGLLLAILARLVDPRLAYTLVFALGLAFATVMTGRVVFSTRTTRRQQVLFAGWYLVVYMVGLGIVNLMNGRSVSPTILAISTILVTAPLGFLGARLIFVGDAQGKAETGSGA